ncbi:hypothetical protein [Cupriavidus metallidurans]|uniref:hypothetical protein n=1 Tax=Cupriavidus metallidurans TaxID=119219 RepID=UPI001CCEBDC5|nr:hypothetical protein [Cupriavidus metallidurans]UBM12718.1 hypothetical protein LAI70_28305 [Cupriavidus metallidurans]
MLSPELMKMIEGKRAQMSGSRVLRFTGNKMRIRLMPHWLGDPSQPFWKDWGMHYVKTPGAAKTVAIPCPDKIFGQACPVCDGISKALMTVGDEHTKELLEDSRSAGRVLVNVINRTANAAHQEPETMELPPSVFWGSKGAGGIIAILQEWPTLLDFGQGMDIVIERTGSGRDTKYGVTLGGGSQQVTNQNIWNALGELNLDKYIEREISFIAQKQPHAIAAIAAVTGMPLALPGAPVMPALAAPTFAAPAGVIAPAAPMAPAPVMAAPAAPAAPAMAAPVAPAMAAPAAPVYAAPAAPVYAAPAQAAPAAPMAPAAPVYAAPAAPAAHVADTGVIDVVARHVPSATAAPAAPGMMVPPGMQVTGITSVANVDDPELAQMLSDLKLPQVG